MLKVPVSPWSFAFGLSLSLLLAAPKVQADSQIYRCGNEYTNQSSRIRQGGCVPVAGQVTRVANARASAGRSAAANRPQQAAPRAQLARHTSARVSQPLQQQRDRDARAILQAELQKAQTRLGSLHQEYNYGQPERIGSETHNHQKYLQRVAELRNSIQRVESDIAGLRRELGRAGG